ncbi:hypothetical protein [Aeoliella mucimassa]|nr:hypothetical protein [Aeoliella mucimassa]
MISYWVPLVLIGWKPVAFTLALIAIAWEMVTVTLEKRKETESTSYANLAEVLITIALVGPAYYFACAGTWPWG